MITGLVLVERGVEALAVTLSALVPGVAEGIIGDAVVLARAPDEGVARVADATGAALVILGPEDDPWRAGAAAARRDWLLCLQDGDMPAEGWIRAVDRFILTAPAGAPPLGRFARPLNVAQRLARIGEGRLRAPRPRAGDLVHRSRLNPGAPLRLSRLPARILRDPG
jgi:hypothetical protein